MADILWPSVVTALIATMDAATAAPVFDGLPITYDDMREFVIVGGDADGENGAGGWDQRITTIGAPFRVEENGRVECMIVTQSGDPTVAPTRAAALAILEAVIDQIDADPTLGLSNLTYGRVTSGRVLSAQTSHGAATEIQFTYTYEGTTGP